MRAVPKPNSLAVLDMIEDVPFGLWRNAESLICTSVLFAVDVHPDLADCMKSLSVEMGFRLNPQRYGFVDTHFS